MEKEINQDSKYIILLEYSHGFNEVFLLKYGENIVIIFNIDRKKRRKVQHHYRHSRN